MSKITSVIYFLLLVNVAVIKSYAQSEDIIDAYENYTEAPREVVYAHLNKSTYIEGEMMGFTAYIFDKNTKERSTVASNLYCTISDGDGNIIKKKLLRVKDGVASNVFDIDSTLSSGVFTFKAYTNWMRNFDEQNHFQQTFKVLDADNTEVIRPINKESIEIDIQALGEGGHLLYNIENSVGIIAKNQFGHGIPNAKGYIVNNQGKRVSEFQLNDVGLAKILFIPQKGEDYTLRINYINKEYTAPINNIKTYGLVLQLLPLDDKIRIVLNTNTLTLTNANNNTYQIALHNGNDMILEEFELDSEGKAVITFPKNILFTGTNIFTVFDDKDRPILERLYFNKESLNHEKLSNVLASKVKDSLNVSLDLDNYNLKQSSNLSVSVLPSGTESYKHNNNILSQVYIQPYVKGYVENASRYFNTDNNNTDYELDILMMTQGWSSYNWNDIFTHEPNYPYEFEQGIKVRANINTQEYGTYVIYPFSENSIQIFDILKNENIFNIQTLFPKEGDSLRIGYFKGKNKRIVEKPSLFLQFKPLQFPDLNTSVRAIEHYFTKDHLFVNPDYIGNAWDNSKVTKLDEVVLVVENRRTELEALKEKAFRYNIDIISDVVKNQNKHLYLYLQQLGWRTRISSAGSNLSITNPRIRRGDAVPAVYLDNMLLNSLPDPSSLSPILSLTMNRVEYIEYNLRGLSTGAKTKNEDSRAGYIKIYTDPMANYRGKNYVSTYDFPLRFNSKKSFYTPKYQNYNSDFYHEYGTIAWQPNVTINNNGKVSFKIMDTETQNISLFVEGIVNSNQFVSQEIKIELEN